MKRALSSRMWTHQHVRGVLVVPTQSNNKIKYECKAPLCTSAMMVCFLWEFWRLITVQVSPWSPTQWHTKLKTLCGSQSASQNSVHKHLLMIKCSTFSADTFYWENRCVFIGAGVFVVGVLSKWRSEGLWRKLSVFRFSGALYRFLSSF